MAATRPSRFTLRVLLLGSLVLTSALNASASGDLTLTRSCNTEVWGNRTFRVVGRLWIGNQRFDNIAEGYGDVFLLLEGTVPASPEARSMSCSIDYYYNDAGSWYYITSDFSSGTLPGSGPNVLNLLIDAFIPYEYISVPWDPIYRNDPSVAEGDNRSFQYYGATARATTVIDLLNPAYNDQTVASGPNHVTGF